MATPPTVRSRALTFSTEVYDPDDFVARLALDAFVDGTQPIARWIDVAHTGPLVADDLVVADGRVSRWMDWGRTTAVLLEGEGWTAALSRRRADDEDDATTAAWVYATSADRLDDVCEQIRKALDRGTPPGSSIVTLRSWNSNGGWADRVVDAPAWADVRRNYAAAVRPALDTLVALGPTTLPSGRLMLLHGVPGTGKSTFIRALARAWAGWCSTEVLGDPQAVLGSSQLIEAISFTQANGDDGGPRPWKVLVVEDAHELVAADAAGGASQSLTRLLHATDGVVGGQAKVLFLLTTNHLLTHVHPALLRPGRCLAEIEIPALPAAEAAAWLGPDVPAPARPMTLAELYAQGTDDDVIRHRTEPTATGQYL